MRVAVTLLLLVLLQACDEEVQQKPKDDIFISSHLECIDVELPEPWLIKYEVHKKEPYNKGRIYYNNEHILWFELNLPLVDDTLKKEFIISDTLTSTLLKEKLIFQRYIQDSVKFLVVKSYDSEDNSSHHHLWAQVNRKLTNDILLYELLSIIKRKEVKSMLNREDTLISNYKKSL